MNASKCQLSRDEQQKRANRNKGFNPSCGRPPTVSCVSLVTRLEAGPAWFSCGPASSPAGVELRGTGIVLSPSWV